MFVRLLSLQLIFILLDAVLAIAGDTASAIPTFPGLYISATDVMLIQIGLFLNFAIFILIFAVWQSIEYRVTTSHLHVEYGIFHYRLESIIDLSAIDRAIVRENWLGKLFNYGMIEISLHSDHKRRAIKLRGIPFPHQFITYLNAQLLLAKTRNNPGEE